MIETFSKNLELTDKIPEQTLSKEKYDPDKRLEPGRHIGEKKYLEKYDPDKRIERKENSLGMNSKMKEIQESTSTWPDNAEERKKIKEESGWTDVIINSIKNKQQYEILKNAELKEVSINGRQCLIKEKIDYNFEDKDGISNRQRIDRGLAPLDSKTGKPLELHHLGQKEDSPLVELTEEEHRTGEYEPGKKNDSVWHDKTISTEVHREGNHWDQDRKAHWKARAKQNEA